MLTDKDPCPNCGGRLDYGDEIDIGVGILAANIGCRDCHWTPDERPNEAPAPPDPAKIEKHEKRLVDMDRAGITKTPRLGWGK